MSPCRAGAREWVVAKRLPLPTVTKSSVGTFGQTAAAHSLRSKRTAVRRQPQQRRGHKDVQPATFAGVAVGRCRGPSVHGDSPGLKDGSDVVVLVQHSQHRPLQQPRRLCRSHPPRPTGSGSSRLRDAPSAAPNRQLAPSATCCRPATPSRLQVSHIPFSHPKEKGEPKRRIKRDGAAHPTSRTLPFTQTCRLRISRFAAVTEGNAAPPELVSTSTILLLTSAASSWRTAKTRQSGAVAPPRIAWPCGPRSSFPGTLLTKDRRRPLQSPPRERPWHCGPEGTQALSCEAEGAPVAPRSRREQAGTAEPAPAGPRGAASAAATAMELPSEEERWMREALQEGSKALEVGEVRPFPAEASGSRS
eukprot:scaffold7029_cov375-Pinguiococcus_pyrenoidosus.AAC.15